MAELTRAAELGQKSGLPEEVVNQVTATMPLRKVATTDDIAAAVVLLSITPGIVAWLTPRLVKR